MRASQTSCAALTALALAALAGCGTSIEVSAPGQAEGPILSIGVADDEPAMSWYHGSSYTGFSIEVARYVAKVLGYASKQIVFRPVPMQSRASMLDDGAVDFVVGAYADRADGESGVYYAGPYLISSQELLVRADGSGDVEDASSLDGRAACAVRGSDAGSALRGRTPGVRIEERDSYQQCVSSLMVGRVDAVAGPAPILAGLREQGGPRYLDVVDVPYATARFGIGVRAGERRLAAQIDDALRRMIADGSWTRAADRLRARTGFAVDAKANPPDLDGSRP